MSDGLEILIDPEVEFVPYYSKIYLSVDTDALDNKCIRKKILDVRATTV
jgi:hypothetical protein